MTLPDFWTLLSASSIDLLGWTLLHFVWQGALVAVLLAGALRLLDDHPPQVRYVVSCAALLTLFVLPVATGTVLSEHVLVEERGAPIASVLPATVGAPSVESAPVPTTIEGARSASWYETAAAGLQPALPWIVVVWGLGVVAYAIRLAGGAWRVRRLRRTSTPAPSKWQDRMRRLADEMGVSGPVALRQSVRIDSPMVVGWWRPAVLVPAGILTGFPPDQVEALLRHELAHVRRHDVLVGRLQAVVEVLLFFHPATWWISKQVRRTREACCDALAVDTGAKRTVYANALTTLAEQAVVGTSPAWTPAASDGSLLGRIQRVLAPSEAPSTHVQRLSVGAAILLLVGMPLGLAACASQSSATEERPPGSSQSKATGSAAQDSIHRSVPRTIMRDDSTGRTMAIRADGSMHTEVKGNGIFVFHLGGETADTIDLRRDWTPSDLDSLREHIRRSFDGQILQMRLDPDSLERAIQPTLDSDSLEGELRRQMEREMPEQLREQARHLREQAERLEERAREMEAQPRPNEPTPPDPNGR